MSTFSAYIRDENSLTLEEDHNGNLCSARARLVDVVPSEVSSHFMPCTLILPLCHTMVTTLT